MENTSGIGPREYFQGARGTPERFDWCVTLSMRGKSSRRTTEVNGRLLPRLEIGAALRLRVDSAL
jgi:hypothetical protein